MKEYFIRVGNELVCVERDVYTAYYKARRREKYVREIEMNRIISYEHAIEDNFPIETIILEAPELEETVLIRKLFVEQLLKCLEDQEKYIINCLFYSDMTEQAIAKHMGISQQALHKRKRRILSKLKNYYKK